MNLASAVHLNEVERDYAIDQIEPTRAAQLDSHKASDDSVADAEPAAAENGPTGQTHEFKQMGGWHRRPSSSWTPNPERWSPRELGQLGWSPAERLSHGCSWLWSRFKHWALDARAGDSVISKAPLQIYSLLLSSTKTKWPGTVVNPHWPIKQRWDKLVSVAALLAVVQTAFACGVIRGV